MGPNPGQQEEQTENTRKIDILSLFTTPIGLDQAHNSIPLCNITILVHNMGHFFPLTVPVNPNQAVSLPPPMTLRDHLLGNLHT
jgi:hypothetical protein